eukprot:1194577-Prorocentrum_minimum.AAC.1
MGYSAKGAVAREVAKWAADWGGQIDESTRADLQQRYVVVVIIGCCWRKCGGARVLPEGCAAYACALRHAGLFVARCVSGEKCRLVVPGMIRRPEGSLRP